MQVMPTRVETRSDAFRENREKNLAAVAKLHEHLARSRGGGGRCHQRGR